MDIGSWIVVFSERQGCGVGRLPSSGSQKMLSDEVPR